MDIILQNQIQMDNTDFYMPLVLHNLDLVLPTLHILFPLQEKCILHFARKNGGWEQYNSSSIMFFE